jgi:hypothetical protein
MLYKNISISLWRKVFRRKYDEDGIVRLLLVSDELIYQIEELILSEIKFVEIEKNKLNFSYFQKEKSEILSNRDRRNKNIN